jgi:Ca-activated chloride channel family protein
LNYQFQYPQAFWLLALIPLFLLLYAGYRLWRRRAIRKAGDPALISLLQKNHSPSKNIIKLVLILTAFALGCLALANPRKPDASSAEERKGIDIIIALDISNSMKAGDIAPDRLSRAKQMVTTLIDQLKDDRLGLVVFAGTAYAQMPLTFDREAARMYVLSADPSAIPSQGTSIGDALEKSLLLFGEQSERFRSIVLITDGETHDENALQDAKELASKGIMINTVGIGSPEGAAIIDSSGQPKRDAAGQPVISKLNEDLLKQLAQSTNGTYVHLQSADAAVREVMAQYADIDKKALGDISLLSYETFYMWLAAPMLLLLLIETFLTDRKKAAA